MQTTRLRLSSNILNHLMKWKKNLTISSKISISLVKREKNLKERHHRHQLLPQLARRLPRSISNRKKLLLLHQLLQRVTQSHRLLLLPPTLIFKSLTNSCSRKCSNIPSFSNPPPPPTSSPSPQQQQSTVSSSSSSSKDLTTPPLPDDNLKNLQQVVNSVDHYAFDMEDLARQQALDSDFHRLLNNAQTGLSFRKIKIGTTFLRIDISNGPARPFVPHSFRRQIFNVIHGLGHPGVKRTRQTISDKFVWPQIQQDITKWARECIPCQQEKVQRHTVLPIAEFAIPAKRFQHMHIDLVSMPVSNGFNHLLTVVDIFLRWPSAFPIPDINAETVVDTFAHGWIASHGVPEVVTSDRGSQFSS